MADEDAGTITARINLNTEGVDDSAHRAEEATNGLLGRFTELNSKLELVKKAFSVVSKVVLPEFVKNSLAAVDSQLELASRLNASVNSLRVLERAGTESGLSIDTLKVSLQGLNARLFETGRKTTEATLVLEDLGIPLKDLSSLDADEKLLTIAKRLNELHATTDQVNFVLNKLGITSPEVFNLIENGGESIEKAKEEVVKFGISLNSIQFEDLEMAADKLDEARNTIKGVSDIVSTKFAPVLTALTEIFFGNEKAVKQFTGTLESGIDLGIKILIPLLNVVDSIKREFLLVAESVYMGIGIPIRSVSKIVEGFIVAFNKIPGINFDEAEKSIKGFNEVASNFLADTSEKISAIFTEQFAGDKLADAIEKAKKQAEEAAKEDDKGGEKKPEEKSDLKLRDLAEEERKKAEADAKAEELRRLKESLAEKVKAIKESTLEEKDLLKAKFEEQDETLKEALKKQVITEKEYNQIRIDAFAEYQQALGDIETRESDKRKKIFEEEQKKKKEILSGALNGLTNLMGSHSKKQFEVGKAAAIASSIIDTYQGMNAALKLGWPLGPIAATAIGIAGFSRVQQIKAQTFNGGGTGSSGSANTSLSQAANQPEAAAPQQTRVATINLHGQLFGRDQVRSLIEQINEEVGDGATVRVA